MVKQVVFSCDMPTKSVLSEFQRQWAKDREPASVSRADLEQAETHFSVAFPSDYIDEITAVGALTADFSLLERITGEEDWTEEEDLPEPDPLDMSDLSQLHDARTIISQTVGWREAGMPDDLIAIGCDCMGSSFCFRTSDLSGERPDSAPILFWDHDFDSIEEVAPGFRDWIDSFNAIDRE